MAAPRLSQRQLNRATLARQMLLHREATGPVEAAERLGALQAQEPRPPFIALWTRLADVTAEEIRDAIRDRRLVRATMMRGTLHLASARDYASLRAAVQPALDRSLQAVLAQRGARELDVEAVLAAARDLLAAQPLTFDEIRAALAPRFPGADDRSVGYAVRMGLPLVMQPSEDRFGFPRAAAFGLADSAGGRRSSERLVRRYLGAFGPATAADFQTWSGVDGDAALERLRKELVTFRDEHGRELFDLPDAPRPEADLPAPPRLLADFDSLLLAHADRARVIADEHRPRVTTKNLRVKATFLIDGCVAGTWKLDGRRVELEPFGRLAKGDRERLAAESDALARFLKA